MRVGQVVYIDFPHASFKWANGLKIVVSKTKDTIDMVDLDEFVIIFLFLILFSAELVAQ